jgi:molecular chaperone DnaJ
MRRSILGSFSSVKVCDACRGTGTIPEEKCSSCRGGGVRNKRSEYSVHIPSGIEDEQMIRMTGAGEAISGGTPGDLYVRVHVRSHALWHKEGHSLVGTLRVKLSDALLGSEYNLETLDGPIALSIPEGVKHNEILRVRGKGVPMNDRHRGDILVTIHIDLPKKLSKEAKKAVEVLKKEGF